jgi:hypothetical protein
MNCLKADFDTILCVFGVFWALFEMLPVFPLGSVLAFFLEVSILRDNGLIPPIPLCAF